MEEAFLKMIEEHQNIIHKICRTYRDRKEDQEDLFQEVVFQLWKAFPSFRRESKLSTWMYRIALNTAIVAFRKKSVGIEYQEVFPEKIHPAVSNEPSENEERMFAALRILNKAERALITLYLEDCSYKEMAEILGISESYVGVQLNRIKNRLKTILK